jgi:hypothetical protein
MLTRFIWITLLLAVIPMWSQTSTGSQMQTPPPVSGEAYSTEVASETRTNYLHTGFVVNSAYSDNVIPGTSMNPVGDASYSISPTIALDQTTARLHQTFTYAPGFTVYQHTSSLNAADQNLTMDIQYRLSPHVTANVRDSFRKSSNVFNQPFTGGAISGSAQSPIVLVVVPIADQISNNANAEISYQFSRNGMVGGSGVFTDLHYPKPNQVAGLGDSNLRGGAAFYSYRIARTSYFGITCQYAATQTALPAIEGGNQKEADSETQTHSALLFFTTYLKPSLSLSLSGGPLHYSVSQYPYPTLRSWAPAAAASMGWQGSRASLAASYSHVVGSGGGLLGAFESNSASVGARWQIARTWTMGSVASYAMTQNVSSSIPQSNPGGHMVSGTVTFQHAISEHLNMEFGYIRLHQSYESVAVISNAPDTNREFVSIAYQFTRPLGR